MTILNGGGVSGVSPQKFDEDIGEVKNDLFTIKTGVADIQSDLTQLSTDVNDAVDEIQETVSNVPAGVPAPNLALQLKSESTDDGIKLTYRANFYMHENGSNYTSGQSGDGHEVVLSITKGVMVRYSTENYPTNIKDGMLAFVDEDLFTRLSDGKITAKDKSKLVTGLTSNQTYYFTAFPYSTYNVYNEIAARTNISKCQWTGTKGTLTVTITQDYDYKTLGEITVTATPTAGGDPVSASRTGAGNVSLSLDGGEYTVSFSAVDYHTAPESQTINVTAGQNNTASAEYRFSASFSECTWNEIKKIADDGNCDLYFSLGDKKSISIKYISTPTSDYKTEPSLSDVTTNLVIVDFDAMEKENGKKANLQLCTEDVVTAFSSAYTVNNPNGYWLGAWCSPEQDNKQIDYPYMRKYVESELNNILPDELLTIITTVKVSASYWRWPGGTSSSPDGMTTGSVNSKLFPPPQEFSYWATNDTRIKKDAKTKSTVKWSTCDGLSYREVYDFQYKSYSETGKISGDTNYSGGLNNVIRHPMCVCI